MSLPATNPIPVVAEEATSSSHAAKDIEPAPEESTSDAILTAEQELLINDSSLDSRFTAKQLAAMNALIPEYTTSLRKQKSHITRGISDQFIKEILGTGATLTKAQRGRILANVQLWFSQRGRKREAQPKFFHPYNGRQVFYKENAKLVKKRQRKLYLKATGRPLNDDDGSNDELEDLDDVERDPQNSSGKPSKPFDFFQLAISEEYNRLGDEERAVYEQKALEWRVRGPSDDVKQARAEKEVGSNLYDFSEHMWKQLGVKLYFFVSYTNTKNQHITAQHDFGKKLYGAKENFRDVGRPIINKSGAWNRWIQYTRDQPTTGDGDGVDGVEGLLLPLPLNEYDEPIIPNPEDVSNRKDDPPYLYFQKVVRSTVSHCYALAMGKPILNYTPTSETTCPWKAIREDPFKFIKRECFPEGETRISDPSSMGKPRNLKFITHWYERQKAGLIPLEFHSYRDAQGEIQPRVPRKKRTQEPCEEDQSNHRRRSARRQVQSRRNRGRSDDSQEGGDSTDDPEDSEDSEETPTKKKVSRRKKRATVESESEGNDDGKEILLKRKVHQRKKRATSESDSSSYDRSHRSRTTRPARRITSPEEHSTSNRTPEPACTPEPTLNPQGTPSGDDFVSPAMADDINALFSPALSDPHRHRSPAHPGQPLPPPVPFPPTSPTRPSRALASLTPQKEGTAEAPPPTTPHKLPGLSSSDVDGLLLERLTSLIQAGGSQNMLLNALQQNVQTPSRALADSLRRVDLASSPSKPSIAEDMDIDEAPGTAGERMETSKGQERAHMSHGDEEDNSDDSGSEDGHAAPEKRPVRQAISAKGKNKQASRSRAIEEVEANVSKMKSETSNVKTAKVTRSKKGRIATEETTVNRGRVGTRTTRRTKSRADAEVEDEDEEDDKISDGLKTSPKRKRATRGSVERNGTARGAVEGPASPSKADQRMLEYAERLVGGPIGGKREPKKKVRVS